VLSDWSVDLDGAQDFDRMARNIQVGEAEVDALAELSGADWADDGDAVETTKDAWVEHELRVLKDRA
jgi:hypothetical protein